MKCRSCEGGRAMLKDGKVAYSTCSDCDAVKALKDGEYEHFDQKIVISGRKMGFIDNIESAYKLCSCLASNHKNGLIPPSDKFIKANNMSQEYTKEINDKHQESINKYQIAKEEEKQYYEQRIKELQQLDEENGGEPIV